MNFSIFLQDDIEHESQFALFIRDDSGDEVDDASAVFDVRTPRGLKDDIAESFFDRSSVSEKGKTPLALLTGIELPERLRGIGLGRKMMEVGLSYCDEIGIEAVYLVADKLSLEKFYKKFGFKTLDQNEYNFLLMKRKAR